MKIFSWMQRKIQGKPASDAKKHSNPHSSTVALKYVPEEEYRKAETSDLWPASGLLAIGTLGLNNNLQKPDTDDQKPNLNDPQTDGTISNDMISTFSPEQVLPMYKNFCSMIEDGEYEQEVGSLDSKRDQKNNTLVKLRRTDRSPSFALSGAMAPKGLKKESGKNYSVPILFKKIYRQAFSPRPMLNPLPESRTDKILRAILHRKIYPRSPSATNHAKTKCLENKPPETTIAQVKCTDSKWIKTDSDYIVLEI